MKTNFEAAVKILIEGRCDAIQPEGTFTKYILRGQTLNHDLGQGINTSPLVFLGQWECLGYKPEMETVEVKAWKWNYDKGPIPATCPEFISSPPTMRDLSCYIELSGTYQRKVQEKQKYTCATCGHVIGS